LGEVGEEQAGCCDELRAVMGETVQWRYVFRRGHRLSKGLRADGSAHVGKTALVSELESRFCADWKELDAEECAATGRSPFACVSGEQA
jgi:hypothetical protein